MLRDEFSYALSYSWDSFVLPCLRRLVDIKVVENFREKLAAQFKNNAEVFFLVLQFHWALRPLWKRILCALMFPSTRCKGTYLEHYHEWCLTRRFLTSYTSHVTKYWHTNSCGTVPSKSNMFQTKVDLLASNVTEALYEVRQRSSSNIGKWWISFVLDLCW